MSPLHSPKGFTLIETLVAIAILSVAIVGPFVAIQTAITSSYVARDQLTASMLAQEGVEYVRSVRDGNYLNNIVYPLIQHSWLYGLNGDDSLPNCVDPDSNTATPYYCTLDPVNDTGKVTVCASSGTVCLPLNYSSARNVYTQTSGAGYVASRFTRTLSIITVSANEVRVIVTVSFTVNHSSYSAVIDEHLFNWL